MKAGRPDAPHWKEVVMQQQLSSPNLPEPAATQAAGRDSHKKIQNKKFDFILYRLSQLL